MGGDECSLDMEAKRKRRQEKRKEKKQESEEIRQIMEEENIKPLDESLLSELDALTGSPPASLPSRARRFLSHHGCDLQESLWLRTRCYSRSLYARPIPWCRSTNTR